jgi:hypothetical protein
MAPSFPHELPLELCRWRGDLAHELLRGNATLPEGALFDRSASSDLSQIVPVEYRADHIVTFHRPEHLGAEEPPAELVVIIESQLKRQDPKEYSWPAYVGMAHRKWKCDVALLVLTKDKAAAEWAKGPFGPQQMQLHPVVVNLSELPHVLSEAEALQMPELAVLIAIGRPTEETARVAIAAIQQLPQEKAELCFDALMLELPAAVRKTLEEEAMIEDYEFGSVYALRFRDRAKKEGVELGKKEGMELGKKEGIELGKKEGIELGKKEGVAEAKRESLSLLRHIALELMKSKLSAPSTAQRALVQALEDEAMLASLISELGRAADEAQAQAAISQMLAS